MKNIVSLSIIFALIIFFTGCGPSYQVKPVSFDSPESMSNAINVEGAIIGAKAFDNKEEAKEAFGFDILGAGMLPVQMVFDNQGPKRFEINGDQTFLVDDQGKMWMILSNKIAYERATKYAETNQMFKEGVHKGALGALAGAVIGAAIGIATDQGVGEAAGKGAAVGAAAGATLGGAGGYSSGSARRDIIDDLHDKSLQNAVIEPESISYGILFFPGEAKTAQKLRFQLVEVESKAAHTVSIPF